MALRPPRQLSSTASAVSTINAQPSGVDIPYLNRHLVRLVWDFWGISERSLMHLLLYLPSFFQLAFSDANLNIPTPTPRPASRRRLAELDARLRRWEENHLRSTRGIGRVGIGIPDRIRRDPRIERAVQLYRGQRRRDRRWNKVRQFRQIFKVTPEEKRLINCFNKDIVPLEKLSKRYPRAYEYLVLTLVNHYEPGAIQYPVSQLNGPSPDVKRKARGFLKSVLTKREWKHLQKHGFILLKSKINKHRVYLVSISTHEPVGVYGYPDITKVRTKSEYHQVGSRCYIPKISYLPKYDNLASKIMKIKYDEEGFLEETEYQPVDQTYRTRTLIRSLPP